MLSLTRASRLLRASLRGRAVPRAPISSRPARDPTSPGEQAVAMAIIFFTFLGPSGWILSNIHSYKKSSG
uniref:Cytochrome c oxidase subunit 8 n=1 Tax=Sarcophilus harrisii TaxID=9305 RepID=A0A7N4NMK5_SARHA